jgi:hypothetical protein
MEPVLKFWRAVFGVRIPPRELVIDEGHDIFTLSGLAITSAIFFLARQTVGGATTDVGDVLLANIISTTIVFAVGFFFVFSKGHVGAILEQIHKWSAFLFICFVLTLLLYTILEGGVTLLFGIAFFELFLDPDVMSDVWFRVSKIAICFFVVYAVITLRTMLLDNRLQLFSFDFILTTIVSGIVITFLVYLLLFRLLV